MTESDLEARLRESLRSRAEQAPDGGPLAERIIAAARASDRTVVRRSFRWQKLVTPLAAAAAVAGIVVALVETSPEADTGSASSANGAAGGKAMRPYGKQAHNVDSAGSSSRTYAAGSGTASAPSATASPSASAASTAGLTGFRATDLTFVSDNEGWAIGTARCLDGSPGRCPAMVHMTDGVHWQSMPTPPISGAGVGIRFANDQIGYAFDPSALYMTTDGGRSWQRQRGRGADALETLDGNVVRVTEVLGCDVPRTAASPNPAPCTVTEVAGLGSSHWTPIGGAGPRADVHLARAGSRFYVAYRGTRSSPAFVESADDRGSTTSYTRACPRRSDPVTALTAAGDRVAVLCGTDRPVLAVSRDDGATFGPTSGSLPAGTKLLAGDPAHVLLAGGPNGLDRSIDGGRSWRPAADVTGTVTFLGFESPTVARAVTDASTLWTTRDGGAYWTPGSF